MRYIKILIFVLGLASGVSFAQSNVYNLDPFHTSVTWQLSHFGFSNPSGKWMIESGTINLDENNLTKSSVNVFIQIDDENSGIQKLDEHIISKQFLDAEEFPDATFISTSVVKKSATKLLVKGNLTLHGVTKPITLDVKLNRLGLHPVSMQKTVGFSAKTQIKRSDFGVKAYLPGLGDTVSLSIEAEAVLSNESSAK